MRYVLKCEQSAETTNVPIENNLLNVQTTSTKVSDYYDDDDEESDQNNGSNQNQADKSVQLSEDDDDLASLNDTLAYGNGSEILHVRSGKINQPKSVINLTNAMQFKHWLEHKSEELLELNNNFSGFKTLNSSYYAHLGKDAKFAWINFTEMIINISSRISDVLYDKTLVVKNLTDLVEKTFKEYASDTDKVVDSTQHLYYDSKSPKAFCDVYEEYNKNKIKGPLKTRNTTPIPTIHMSSQSSSSGSSTTYSSGQSDEAGKMPRSKRKIGEQLDEDEENDDDDDDDSELIFNFDELDYRSKRDAVKIENMSDEPDDSSTKSGEKLNNPKYENVSISKKITASTTKKTKTKKTKVTSTSTTKTPITTTPITTPPKTSTEINDLDDEDDDGEYEGEGDNSIGFLDNTFSEQFWDITCLNRTFDENFKAVQRINRHKSSVQVPVNVFKQDIAINMTAYWTEALDEQFKKNYDSDNELFWQYFCSTNGLFRRYPSAYWSVSKNDFFDCRLQTWYIMGAASPKDAIILLDTSGSMTGLRLEIGKRLIEFIIDTFSDNDFFNIMTFSNTVQYLLHDEPDYVDKFIQAGKANKQKFVDRLHIFKNTSQQARLAKPLEKVFTLFNESGSERSCSNKMIMIITDGHADDVHPIFEKYNSDKRIRVFSFKIGRDMTDPKEIKELACNNNGQFYHVVTLTDINEHVYEYIPVLSRPMALKNNPETAWSNVFIGYLDKELKIAVARPAFRDVSINLNDYEINTYKGLNLSFKVDNFEKHVKKNKNAHMYYITNDSEMDLIQKAEKEMRTQQVLLGVVGIDVPVLRLISKVSPKYQMGVGIYIIMLDNNGFIVYHPSIKKEIAMSAFDFKGTSHSIDMNKFEIPIGNEEEFEELEHEMIDQITSNKTLENWKREGLRVIRRKTEYVFTSVFKTPFSVAIASPSSFGRYYIDLPSERESDYVEQLKEILQKKQIPTSSIQLYNCSYSYNRMLEKLLNPKQNLDFCIRYLHEDIDQVLAMKSDLLLHNSYFHLYNFSLFVQNKNLVLSAFYGTYSGITFYLPVTFARSKGESSANASSSSFASHVDEADEYELYNATYNLFSTETNKHTYSFEKQYYTRSIEFSDYLRTELKTHHEPVVIYFLNETTKDSIDDTISAALPIWYDKVPTAVAGVVYDSRKLRKLIFDSPASCESEDCMNLCHRRAELNLTCYLVDEHAIVIMTNSEEPAKVGQTLYKINPWLMLQLEIEGLYDLVIPGSQLEDCSSLPTKYNSASAIFSFVKHGLALIQSVLYFLVYSLMQFVTYAQVSAKTSSSSSAAAAAASAELVNSMNLKRLEWRIRNNHCFYFGVYSFNINKWKQTDSSEVKVWCNSTKIQKHYLAGYLKHSNLLLLVVEEDNDNTLFECGNMKDLVKQRPASWNSRIKTSSSTINTNKSNDTNTSNSTINKYKINRYRKNPESCHNYFPNESSIFFCKSSSSSIRTGYIGISLGLLVKFVSLFLI
jgi:hypothetical protein